MIEVTLLEKMGSDLTVVNSARVSFAKTHFKFDDEKDERLIKYLAKHRHTSPFGHAFARFHVKAPVFVARQLVKHKFLRWNEISRRYVDSEPEFYTPTKWRASAEDKKQGSSDEEVEMLHLMKQDDELSVEGHPHYDNYSIKPSVVMNEVYDMVLEAYNDMLQGGVCPEQARMLLPQSMMTEWYWSGSLDAFADMCNLRCYPDAQKETREVADHIDKIMEGYFPVSWKALRSDA